MLGTFEGIAIPAVIVAFVVITLLSLRSQEYSEKQTGAFVHGWIIGVFFLFVFTITVLIYA